MNFGVQGSRSICGFQNDAFGHFAVGSKLPQGNQQLSRQRDDHRLADARSSVLRSLPEPASQLAIRLVHQEPPGELDHSVSNARIDCSGQSFLAAFRATFIRRSRQATIVRQCPPICYVAIEELARQHIRRIKTEPPNHRKLLNHEIMLSMMLTALVLRKLLLSLLFDLVNLRSDERQSIHGALNFGKGVRRNWPAFRREKPFELFESPLQMWFEVPSTKPGERSFQAVDQPCLLAIQPLAFPVRAPGILFLDCRDRSHPAVIILSAQPTQEGPQQQLTIQTVGFCATMLPLHPDAGGMHHMRLNAIVPQPARQPEPVSASLVGNADPGDCTADLFLSLIAPAVHLRQQLVFIDRQFFRRTPLHSGQHSVDQQAGLAPFHYHDHCGRHIESDA